MPVYRTSGHLTGTILPENVPTAQRYLTHEHGGAPRNMQRYLDPPLRDRVVFLEWNLSADGHNYTITAVTNKLLTEEELKQLSSECSGQNSDGLGEGFEQQDFAWVDDGEEDETCYDCDGSGRIELENGDTDVCGTCDGEGVFYGNIDNGHMISFDWKTNELPWTQIA